jgi:hypothetical protein
VPQAQTLPRHSTWRWRGRCRGCRRGRGPGRWRYGWRRRECSHSHPAAAEPDGLSPAIAVTRTLAATAHVVPGCVCALPAAPAGAGPGPGSRPGRESTPAAGPATVMRPPPSEVPDVDHSGAL